MKTLAAVAACVFVLNTGSAQAHLVRHVHPHYPRYMQHRIATKNLGHAEYVCARGSGHPKHEHCRAIPWLKRLFNATAPPPPIDYWVAKQIRVATIIGSEPGSNPWPNCPDPFHDGASWSDLVRCENGGSWYDSPGHFRCGLQFEPMWETRFGRLCP